MKYLMRKPKITRSFHSLLKNYTPDKALIVTKTYGLKKSLVKQK